jgi:hypothetical protein
MREEFLAEDIADNSFDFHKYGEGSDFSGRTIRSDVKSFTSINS